MFDEWSRIELQVRGGATITYGHEQNEVQNPNDGLQLTLASTNPPYATWWKGEFWYGASATGSSLILVFVGKADQNFHP